MIKLSGLWKHTDANGKQFLSGNMGGARILIMVNSFKEKDNDPDYNLYIAESVKRQPGQILEDTDIPF